MIGEIIAKMFDKMIRHWKIEITIVILFTVIGIIKNSDAGCGVFLQWMC